MATSFAESPLRTIRWNGQKVADIRPHQIRPQAIHFGVRALVAGGEPRLKAGAQRTLEGVGSSALIMYEASPTTYPGGMLVVENSVNDEVRDLMRFDTDQHPFYCGID